MRTSFLTIAFFTFIYCQFGILKQTPQDKCCTTNKSLTANKAQKNDFDTLQIRCDSVYKNKGYKITLITFGKENENESDFNSVFILKKLINNNYKEVFRDSIYSSTQVIKFNDFNNDQVKDILVQNISDVRSNWTYHLYLVDTKRDKLKKVQGFEEIKNPNYLPQYNLIDNYVMSGRNWTSFYKIQGNKIKDFGIEVLDGANDKGNTTYDKDYKKAIKIILAIKNNH